MSIIEKRGFRDCNTGNWGNREFRCDLGRGMHLKIFVKRSQPLASSKRFHTTSPNYADSRACPPGKAFSQWSGSTLDAKVNPLGIFEAVGGVQASPTGLASLVVRLPSGPSSRPTLFLPRSLWVCPKIATPLLSILHSYCEEKWGSRAARPPTVMVGMHGSLGAIQCKRLLVHRFEVSYSCMPF
jgi:hypothetical protein